MWIDDVVISECEKTYHNNIFVPKDTVVVLGRGNKADIECNEAACKEDGIPVLKRYGGGGTVVLHDGCLVVSSGIWVDDHFKNDLYFRLINDAVIETIYKVSGKTPEIEQRGISDLAINGKKIAGTSMFRSKNYLLYQASILVDTNIDMISRYLLHPSKEPDYRKGKSHKDFLTCLAAFDKDLTVNKLELGFKEFYAKALEEKLEDHMIDPISDHFKHLRKRVERGI